MVTRSMSRNLSAVHPMTTRGMTEHRIFKTRRVRFPVPTPCRKTRSIQICANDGADDGADDGLLDDWTIVPSLVPKVSTPGHLLRLQLHLAPFSLSVPQGRPQRPLLKRANVAKMPHPGQKTRSSALSQPVLGPFSVMVALSVLGQTNPTLRHLRKPEVFEQNTRLQARPGNVRCKSRRPFKIYH